MKSLNHNITDACNEWRLNVINALADDNFQMHQRHLNLEPNIIRCSYSFKITKLIKYLIKLKGYVSNQKLAIQNQIHFLCLINVN